MASAYDEVLIEVAARVQAAGSIGKSDIGALLLWKRLRAHGRDEAARYSRGVGAQHGDAGALVDLEPVISASLDVLDGGQR